MQSYKDCFGECAENGNAGGKRLDESLLRFDNPKEFLWEEGSPRLQYSRILFWSEEELLTPVAESVISIHEAFHVPLFYFRTSIDDVARDIDYIAFVGSFGVDGFWGLRQNAFHPYQDTVFTDPMNEGCIPELGDVREHYRKLLLDSKIVFAADARHVLKKRGKLL